MRCTRKARTGGVRPFVPPQAACRVRLGRILSVLCVKPLTTSMLMNDTQRLLDSSVVIRHFRLGGETSILLESFTELYLPSIALGELYAGACRSARPDKNLAQIEEFLASVTMLPSDEAEALHYGRISANLAAKGTPIPQNDMWIAACAMQWNLTLATTDQHYSQIEGLSCEMW